MSDASPFRNLNYRFHCFFAVLFLVLCSADLSAQVADTTKADTTKKQEEPKYSFRRLINTSYSTLLGAEGGTGTIGNYASVDPLNGGVSFKGTITLGDLERKRVKFLSISAQGSLVDGSFATVFKNTKLPTTAGIQADYSFRIFNGKYSVDGPKKASLFYDRAVIEQKLKKDTAENNASLLKSKLEEKIVELDAANKFSAGQLSKYKKDIAMLKSAMEKSPDLTLLHPMTEQLNKYLAEAQRLEKSIARVALQIDSVNLLKSQIGLSDLLLYRNNELEAAAKSKKQLLEDKLEFLEMSFTWLTVTGGVGKKSWYTYDRSQPFSLQLDDPNMPTLKLGLALNHFSYDAIQESGWLLNGGFLWMRDNNLEKLTSQEFAQEAIFKNAAGDTVRKVVKKYQAYTELDKIQRFQMWNVYGNLYHVFRGGDIALHLFPSFYKPKGSHGYIDGGLGILFAFKDQKKEKTTLNLEAFLVLSDLSNSLDNSDRLIDRNEFGVRVTLPFNKLFK